MKIINSPLRYPGSKASLSTYIEDFLSGNLLLGCHFFEMYAGGASLSLHLLSNQFIKKATLVEKDPLIYSFWKCLKYQPEELIRLIQSVPIDILTWTKMQQYLKVNKVNKSNLPEMALACLFLNRTCFSGIIDAGPIGGINQQSKYSISCRFNKKTLIHSIKLISQFSNKFEVVLNDAIAYLQNNRARLKSCDCLVYVDPPYLQQGKKLYRYHYGIKDHQRLADFIRIQEFPWLVSYDDHSTIYDLFRGNKILTLYLNYAARQSKNAKELLISNMYLPLSDSKYKANYLSKVKLIS